MLPVENIIASFCRGLQCARARRRGNRPYTFEQAVGAEFGNDSLEVTVTDAEVFRGLCEPLLECIAAAGVVYVAREAHLNGVGGVEGLVVAYVSEPFTEAACDEGEEGVARSSCSRQRAILSPRQWHSRRACTEMVVSRALTSSSSPRISKAEANSTTLTLPLW